MSDTAKIVSAFGDQVLQLVLLRSLSLAGVNRPRRVAEVKVSLLALEVGLGFKAKLIIFLQIRLRTCKGGASCGVNKLISGEV